MGVLTEKLLLLVAIVITTIASIVLVAIRDVRFPGPGGFYRFVHSERSSITVIFGLLSGNLGSLQMYVAGSLFAFAFRIKLEEGSMVLGYLYRWMKFPAVPLKQMFGHNMSKTGFILCAAVFAINKARGPSALWQGALAPNDATVDRHGLIQIPIFTNSTKSVWDNQFRPSGEAEPDNIETNCTSQNNEFGFVSSCPVPDLQGSLLTSASSATTVSGAVRNHLKLDNPSWSFKGRSYGVGSSQGIVPPIFDGSPKTYKYTEVGYEATVSCIKNSSTEFGLYHLEDTEDEYVAVWAIIGQLPNSGGYVEDYPSFSWAGSDAVLGWLSFVNPEADDRNMIGIAGGPLYDNLNQTQCLVTFNPQKFNVSVNVTEQSIVVNPCSNCTDVVDIEPTGRLMDATMWSVNLLSRMSPSLYESVLGNTLQRNVQNLLNRPGLNMTTDEATLQAISDSFTAMIDDILVAFGSAQLALSKASTTTPLTGTVPAVKLGEDSYIFATFGVNAFLLLLVAIAAAWTRLWQNLPDFDCTDPKALIEASDGSIAKEVSKSKNAGKNGGDLGIQLRHGTLKIAEESSKTLDSAD